MSRILDEAAVPRELLDVRTAAGLVGRHPETVRRWIWSGRLPAERRRNRLLIARADLLALDVGGVEEIDLAVWAQRAQAAREASSGLAVRQGAAGLVLEDREGRSIVRGARAGR